MFGNLTDNIRYTNLIEVNCSFPWQYCVKGLPLSHLYGYLHERSGPLKWMGTEAFDFFIFRIPSSRWVMPVGWKETMSYDLSTLPSEGQQRLATWNPEKSKKKNLRKEVSTAVEMTLYAADYVCISSSQMWPGYDGKKRRKLWRVTPWPS